jgi:hypothetical protein
MAASKVLLVASACLSTVIFDNVAPPSTVLVYRNREQHNRLCTKNQITNACGLNNVQPVQTLVLHNSARDWYFHLPLWLQTPCCGHILWARNRAQLAFLEGYVAAKLREDVPNINQSLVSRLPRWLKSAKNRADVLRGVERLKQKAAAL